MKIQELLDDHSPVTSLTLTRTHTFRSCETITSGIVDVDAAGWEPVTKARSSDARVFVERHRGGTRHDLAVRDKRDTTASVEITLETDAEPGGAESLAPWRESAEWSPVAESSRVIRLELAPHETRLLRIDT